MAIQKIKISNFKCFKGLIEIELNIQNKIHKTTYL